MFSYSLLEDSGDDLVYDLLRKIGRSVVYESKCEFDVIDVVGSDDVKPESAKVETSTSKPSPMMTPTKERAASGDISGEDVYCDPKFAGSFVSV